MENRGIRDRFLSTAQQRLNESRYAAYLHYKNNRSYFIGYKNTRTDFALHGLHGRDRFCKDLCKKLHVQPCL